MQKIVPCLWYDSNAQEAVDFYLSIFKDGKVLDDSKYGESGSEVSGQKEGSVLTITFELNNQKFMALNGGPIFKFTPALSLMIYTKDQEETDYFWEKMSEGGKKGQCGWLEDKFGVSWQIVPIELEELISNPEKSEKVMSALLKMEKIDIAKLREAAN